MHANTMSTPKPRLRQRPSARFAGSEHLIDLDEALATLRAEPRPTVQGHRQVTLFHENALRLVLFAFDAGGRLPQHSAPGPVTLHALRGALRVRTPNTTHALREGQLLLLDANVPIDVDAADEADMLLSISLEKE